MADSENFILDAGAMINVAVLEAQASQGQKLLKGFAKELALIKQQQVEVDKKILSETSKINEDHRRQMEALKKDTKSSVNEIAQAYVLLTETTRASFEKLHEGSSRAIHSLGEKEIATMNAMTEAANRLTDAQKNLASARGAMRGGIGVGNLSAMDPAAGWAAEKELGRIAAASAMESTEKWRAEEEHYNRLAGNTAEYRAEVQQAMMATKQWSIADAELHVRFREVNKEIERRQQRIRELSDSMEGGRDQSTMNAIQHEVAKVKELVAVRGDLNTEMATGTDISTKQRMVIQQLTYGFQDFISAGGASGQMLMGLRGALNNVEMAIMASASSMTPFKMALMSIGPSIAFAGIGILAQHFQQSNENAKKAADDGLEKYKSGIQGIREEVEKLTNSEEGLEDMRASRRFQESRSGLKTKIEEAEGIYKQKRLLADTARNAEANSPDPFGMMKSSRVSAEREELSAKNALDSLQRKESDLLAEESNRKGLVDADRATRQIRPKLTEYIVRAMQSRVPDAEIRGRLREMYGNAFPPGVLDASVNKIMDDARKSSIGKEIERRMENIDPSNRFRADIEKNSDQNALLGIKARDVASRQRANSAALRDIDTEEMNLKAQSPDGQLAPSVEEKFKKRRLPLQAQGRQLANEAGGIADEQARLADARAKLDEQQKALDRLQRDNPAALMKENNDLMGQLVGFAKKLLGIVETPDGHPQVNRNAGVP